MWMLLSILSILLEFYVLRFQYQVKKTSLCLWSFTETNMEICEIERTTTADSLSCDYIETVSLYSLFCVVELFSVATTS